MKSEHPEPPRMVVVHTGGNEFEVHAIADFLKANSIAALVAPTPTPFGLGTQMLQEFQRQVVAPAEQAEEAHRLLESSYRNGKTRSRRRVRPWEQPSKVHAIIFLGMVLFGLLAAIYALFHFGR